MTVYIETTLNFFWLQVSMGGVLITKDPNILLESKKLTKLLGVVGWNLMSLAYKAFMNKHGSEIVYSIICP